LVNSNIKVILPQSQLPVGNQGVNFAVICQNSEKGKKQSSSPPLNVGVIIMSIGICDDLPEDYFLFEQCEGRWCRNWYWKKSHSRQRLL
jgi:hypothetical protein